MRVLNEEELRALKAALSELMCFVKHTEWKGETYFYRFLCIMKNNIEIYQYTHSKETERLCVSLRKDWENANDEMTGIPSCELQIEKERRWEVFLHYTELLDEVRKFFE